MQIQLLSDLHLETHPHFQARPAPGADLLVLAGDIGSYQYGSLLPDADFGLVRFSPLHGWPVPVLYVPGNHEYDALDFDATHARLRETCERLDIHWLEREVLPVTDRDGRAFRFVGTTLWSDFDALADVPARSKRKSAARRGPARPGELGTPATHHTTPCAVGPDSPLTRQLQARERAFRAANFYLRTTGGTRHGQPLLAAQVREQALACQQWLRDALAQPFDGTTVVVTHFAPSLQSADPRYGLTPGTAGFCNALDDLMAHATLWLHGHLHAPSDYCVRGERDGAAWQCRVVANPLGYARKNEQAAFRDGWCITV
ncbi:MAG: metallophosphoesterase [Burkholderiaceae bacterium]|nr:metallophosphoesterase [Burkholderiaceae bacterium]MDZ4144249.1 metallophosphoesterase [Burkholderiales bacterium]